MSGKKMRRVAGLLAAGLATMALTGPAPLARAAQVESDSVEGLGFANGVAQTTALRVRLTLAGGLPGVPEPLVLEQVVGDVYNMVRYASDQQELRQHEINVRNALKDGTAVPEAPNKADLLDKAEGFAVPLALSLRGLPEPIRATLDSLEGTVEGLLNRDLVTVDDEGVRVFLKAASKCRNEGTNCATIENAPGVEIPLADLGVVEVGSGSSAAEGIFEWAPRVHSQSALTHVNIGLESLLAPGQPLAALGDVLRTLTTTINTSVLPVVAGAVGDVRDAVQGNPTGRQVLDLLDEYVEIEIGDETTVNPIPNLDEVDLLDLTVLGADGLLNSEKGKPAELPDGTVIHDGTGVRASASSKVADISVLGGWVTIGAIGLDTTAFANMVQGAADANAEVTVADVNLGELLGLRIPVEGIRNLADREVLKAKLRELAPPAAQAAIEELIAAVDMLYNIAGLTVDVFPTARGRMLADGSCGGKGPSALDACAEAGTLRLVVEPKIPDTALLLEELAKGRVPRLAPDDYKPVGLLLEVEFPQAASRVNLQAVQASFFNRTGVPTHWIAAIVLIGVALAVRRFVVAR